MLAKTEATVGFKGLTDPLSGLIRSNFRVCEGTAFCSQVLDLNETLHLSRSLPVSWKQGPGRNSARCARTPPEPRTRAGQIPEGTAVPAKGWDPAAWLGLGDGGKDD